MPLVEFDNEDSNFNSFKYVQVPRGIVAWLLDKKIVRSEKSAAILAISLCVACLVILLVTIKFNSSNNGGIVTEMPSEIVPVNDQQIPQA